MSLLLHGREHTPIPVPAGAVIGRPRITFSGEPDKCCLALVQDGGRRYLQPGYYVGADWLQIGELAVQVQPKLNAGPQRVDHLRMLFDCLKQPELVEYVGRLYQLEVDAPFIELPRRDDLLTPLLVGHFLHLLQTVLRQGLKKGYHPVARELRGRTKGKLDVGQTLRRGTYRQRPLLMACTYSEFSTDIPENRLLKQALHLARRSLSLYAGFAAALEPLLRFCEPAFASVSEATTNRRAAPVYNPLYRAYDEALRVGWLLVKRFGYSPQAAEATRPDRVLVPPHWIDMAYLFELYVLGLLRVRCGGKAVLYGQAQAGGHYGLPDFLLPGPEPWIIDAKYKPRYQQRGTYDIEDVRQLSGYARDNEVLAKLGIAPPARETVVVRCLLIYPDRLGEASDPEAHRPAAVTALPDPTAWQAHPLREFVRFYKLAVKLP